MSIARSALVVGPAKCVFNSATFYTNESFEARHVRDQFRVQPLGFTQGDPRDQDRRIEFDVLPDGRWSAAMIAALWPFLNGTPGASMFTSSDVPFVAHDSNSHLYTVKAAAVIKPPQLVLSAKRTLMGAATFLGLVASDADPDDADAYFTYAASGGTFADTGFALTAIKTQPYTAAWSGVTGMTSFVSEDGFTVDTEFQTAPIVVDGLGTLDHRITGVRVMVKCKPVGPTAAQLTAAQKFSGSGNALGASGSGAGAALTITGADAVVYVSIPKATMYTVGMRFGADVLRNGEVGFEACLTPSTGAQQALMTLAAS